MNFRKINVSRVSIYIDIDNLISNWNPSTMSSEYFSLSTGITDNDFTRLRTDFYKLKNGGILVNFICIDVANGYMFKLIDFCKKVREEFPNVTLIAGNVVSARNCRRVNY